MPTPGTVTSDDYLTLEQLRNTYNALRRCVLDTGGSLTAELVTGKMSAHLEQRILSALGRSVSMSALTPIIMAQTLLQSDECRTAFMRTNATGKQAVRDTLSALGLEQARAYADRGFLVLDAARDAELATSDIVAKLADMMLEYVGGDLDPDNTTPEIRESLEVIKALPGAVARAIAGQEPTQQPPPSPPALNPSPDQTGDDQ
jgi:hypothetical protein